MLQKRSFYTVKTGKQFSYKDGLVVFELEKDYSIFNEIENEKFKSIIFSELPKISLHSGVYLFTLSDNLTAKSDIAYIGSSKILNNRLYCHPVARMLHFATHKSLKFQAFFLETSDYKTRELQLIMKFKPFLNVIPPKNKTIEYTYTTKYNKDKKNINKQKLLNC